MWYIENMAREKGPTPKEILKAEEAGKRMLAEVERLSKIPSKVNREFLRKLVKV
jgi:hypothetical protein